MDPQKRFIDNIRLKKFGIGSGELNPLALDVNEAVKQLSAELYQKDLHFVMELLQNAEDNKYTNGIMPTIEFLLTNNDVARVGAVGTLLVLNNEVGFEEPNILSLCSIGQSTKKGKRQSGGYVGEKGIGFKSVFLVSKKPHIISNGFQIYFNQAPNEEAKVGYIVPTWVDNPSILYELNAIYGHEELPKTTIMLPICDEKIVRSVRDQLKELSPELVLFLSKIQKICFDFEGTKYSVIRQAEENSGSMLRKVELSQVEEGVSRSVKHVCYYLWTDRFDVKEESRIEQRKDVNELVISIAFPMGKRITGSLGVGDVFAFLPTQIKSGFRFLINSDFLLVSSRESIHYDSPWNKGILERIPQAFHNAFQNLLHTLPLSEIVSIYDFVPYEASPGFDHVGRKILISLQSATVILCAMNVGFPYRDVDSKFCTPEMARMVNSSLREILEEAAEMGMPPPGLIQRGSIRIVDKRLQEKQSKALSKLKVPYLTAAEFSQLLSEEWLLALPEECYLKVLCYISGSVGSRDMHYFRYTPLIKYIDEETGKVEMASIAVASSSSEWRIYRPHNDQAWIGDWAKEFTPQVGIAFMSQETVECMLKVSERLKDSHIEITQLENWLENHAHVTALNTTQFTEQLVGKFKDSDDSRVLIKIIHFLYNAQKAKHMTKEATKKFAEQINFLDSSGIVKKSDGLTVVLPPSVSEWPILITDGSWDGHLLKLSDAYLRDPFILAGRDVHHLDSEDFILFLKDACRGNDIPNIHLNNLPLPILKYTDPGFLPLKAILLLFKWMKAACCQHRNDLERFQKSIQERAWLKTIHHGRKCPTEAFLYQQGSKWRRAFESDDLPFIDESFYGGDLSDYNHLLKWIGVSTDGDDISSSCTKIAKFIGSESSSSRMTHETVVRLYSYMQTVSWRPETSTSIPISVPDCRKMAIWKQKDKCVIEDKTGFFVNRLSVLARHYDIKLLDYFKNYLHVPATPKAKEYTQLWLDWSSSSPNGIVKMEDCKKVWHVIATNWASSYSQNVKNRFIAGCQQVPSCNNIRGGNHRQVRMTSVSEVLVVDDMCTVQVFEEANMCPRLAWFPTDSESAQWLPKLKSVYKDLGLALLSQCVTKTVLPFDKSTCNLIRREDGHFWKKGMWRLVLGYLATPSFGLTFLQRKYLVSVVTGTTEYKVLNGFTRTFTLSRGFCSNTRRSTNRTLLVDWDKTQKKMFYSERHDNIGEMRKNMELMHEFAECISMGLLSEQYPSLIGGLQELLLMAGGYMFDDSAMSALLRIRNMQLFDEDEAFLDDLNCVL